MEGTTTLYTPIGCGGLERKFGFTVVAAPTGHSGNVRCDTYRPRFGTGQGRR